jgi:hypothetical protein
MYSCARVSVGKALRVGVGGTGVGWGGVPDSGVKVGPTGSATVAVGGMGVEVGSTAATVGGSVAGGRVGKADSGGLGVTVIMITFGSGVGEMTTTSETGGRPPPQLTNPNKPMPSRIIASSPKVRLGMVEHSPSQIHRS